MVEEHTISAEEIINYRKKSNITREELAGKLGVTTTTIHNWENKNNICRGKNATKILDLIRNQNTKKERLNGEIELNLKFKNIEKKEIKELLKSLQSPEDKTNLNQKVCVNMIIGAQILIQ